MSGRTRSSRRRRLFRAGARPATAEVVGFIDRHRGRLGVEPICRVRTERGCKVAPNTYWTARKRPPSKRAIRDAELKVDIQRFYDENLFVYGAGKVLRHRLNRGGNRQANSALCRIVISRMSDHPPTRAYVERRRAESKSTGEIVRALKRYVAHEVYKHLPHPT